MPKVKAKAAMKMILNDDESGIMPPVQSAADMGPLDPEQFMKELPKKRSAITGKHRYPVAETKDIVRVPSYKLALVKRYEDLPKNFNRKAMAMFAEGNTEAEIQAVFGIAKASWDEWLKQYPEFAEFVTAGMTRAQAWWERQARAFVSEPASKFNSALWFMNMKNRFGYRDQKDVNVTEKSLVGFVMLPPVDEDPKAVPGEVISVE